MSNYLIISLLVFLSFSTAHADEPIRVGSCDVMKQVSGLWVDASGTTSPWKYGIHPYLSIPIASTASWDQVNTTPFGVASEFTAEIQTNVMGLGVLTVTDLQANISLIQDTIYNPNLTNMSWKVNTIDTLYQINCYLESNDPDRIF